MPCWVDTSQPDPEAAANFYRDLFGWEVENAMPADSPMKYFIGRIRGGDVAAVGSQSEGSPPVPTWNTYIWVDSVDATAEQVKAAGGQVLMDPMDVMDAGRMAAFGDPEGAVFFGWQPKNHKGSQVVNEHGSVTSNDLNTRDLESAKAFYGAVFGWTVFGGGGGLMWQLPGYADHLEQINPGFKQGITEAGAPEGFGDVVAFINPITNDQPDMGAHWSVRFAVDDADAAAQKTTELGGQVVVPPFDAPWVRHTVLQDPQGATFTASKFVPENASLAAPAGSTADAA
ncbi:MAG TPA: VOC family protein [Thermoleophilaceae bacterium]|nr:VOC family protein [Thermoleophilaceae bacterium]